jgi:TM2 domain-containing membrane protein YozV
MNRDLMEYDARKKSRLISYALWFFFGVFGAHRFYLGRNGSAAGLLALTVVGALLTITGVGMLVFVPVAIWWLIDAVLIPGMVQEQNLALARSLTPQPQRERRASLVRPTQQQPSKPSWPD